MKTERMFYMPCCDIWHSFTLNDFSYNNCMTLICHKHSEPVVKYITWKSGMDKKDFDKTIGKNKK